VPHASAVHFGAMTFSAVSQEEVRF